MAKKKREFTTTGGPITFKQVGREIREFRAAADKALAEASVAAVDHTKCPECGESKPITAVYCRRCFYDLKGWTKDPDSI